MKKLLFISKVICHMRKTEWKKSILSFLFFIHSPIAYSRTVDLYTDCLHNKSYCYTYINGVRFGYNRGLYDGNKQVIN